ncbi:hypothetical protein [Streptomyces sp. NPDC088847]|uniref:hypothetical protein n=1 Tax=Streptomyces sp. NPDC088847 TaxID=3365909 RepID=UPI0037F6D959
MFAGIRERSTDEDHQVVCPVREFRPGQECAAAITRATASSAAVGALPDDLDAELPYG